MSDTTDRTLVLVFLRGGLDGLNTVVPHAEDAYHTLRPGLRLRSPRPGDSPDGLLPLDDRFAFNPGLAALLPAYREGRLAVVHAIGSDDRTRSHFEAQDQMEHGAAFDRPLPGGWLARWLRAAGGDGALAAMAFGPALPESLRGAPAATAVQSLDDVRLPVRSGSPDAFVRALARLHAPREEPTSRPHRSAARHLIRRSGRDALALLERVDELRADPGSRGAYPDTPLARSLAQIERLVRKDVGLRVATVDHGGFDTHFGQAFLLADRLKELAEALAAFETSLGSLRDRVTVLCLTEFGRRAYENASLGTDHGRASCALVLGGGVRGGRVLGDWPGLAEGRLEEPGDLRVTTDYRDLCWEVLTRRFGASGRERVFPGLAHRPVGAMA